MKAKAISFFLLTLLLIGSSAYSQSEEEKIRITVAPLNLFDPVAGVLQVGIQKNLNQRLALSLDHGFKMQTFKNLIFEHGNDRKNYRYSKTKAELKYFIGKPTSIATSYLSLEGMFFPQKYVKERGQLVRDTTRYRYEYSDINRTVWVASLKYGVEFKFNNFVFDHFYGLGVRRLSIKHQPFGLVDDEYFEDAYVWPTIDRKEGVFYRPHLSLGLKVGYIIR
jgi:hypothetical protein